MYSTDSFLVNDRQVDRKLNFLKYIDRNKTWLLESCDLRFQIGFLVPSDSNTSHNPRYISQHILFKIRKAPIFLYLSIFNEIFNHNFFFIPQISNIGHKECKYSHDVGDPNMSHYSITYRLYFGLLKFHESFLFFRENKNKHKLSSI